MALLLVLLVAVTAIVISSRLRGVNPVVFSGAPIAMDAATTAARQREGGGAPNQRRPARDGSLLKDLWRRLQGSLRATHPS